MVAMSSWAVLVAVVLMQCCNVVIVAARPLPMETPAVATADGGWLGMIMQLRLFEPGPCSTCVIISSQPPSAGASISSGLAPTTMLQHCISATATSIAQLIAAIVAVAIQYPFK
uniref:Uncharacterized protein n=1 Tax=Zea mays TaxID=4577 RepID=A0A804LE47_MAIZE